jgi:hypothetical protein
VAVALHALRLDAQRELLEELANASAGTIPTIQAKAVALVGGN